MSLNGKVIIVTGANRGLGKVLSLALGREGAVVVAAARKLGGPASAQATVDLIEEQGGNGLAVQCDVGVPDQVKSMADMAVQRYGRIDGLVNNAALLVYANIIDLAVEDWIAILSANTTGPFLCCKYVIPHMMSQGGGSIVNVSSTLARRHKEDDLIYSSSKAALDRFSLNLAEDVRRHNVAVNSYCPGRLDTDMIDTTVRPADPPEVAIPPIFWMLQQDASTFTGHLIERKDFGVTWGEG